MNAPGTAAAIEGVPQTIFSLSIYTFVLGALVATLIIGFGLMLLRNRSKWLWRNKPDLEPFEVVLHEIKNLLQAGGPSQKDIAPLVASWSAAIYGDYLARRNEFWVSYGQITVAVLLLTVVTVLLLTRTINPDAGLPILSGIAGFTIAKTTSSARGTSFPRPGGEG